VKGRSGVLMRLITFFVDFFFVFFLIAGPQEELRFRSREKPQITFFATERDPPGFGLNDRVLFLEDQHYSPQ